MVSPLRRYRPLDKILITRHSYVFITVQNDLDPAAFQVTSGRTVRLYLSLFILAYLFQFIIVYDALRLSSMIQVVGVCIYNLFLLAYAVVQPIHIEKDLNLLSESLVLGVRPILPPDLNTWSRVRPFLWVVMSVQAVATGTVFYLAFKLHSELAWLVYKVINADLSIRRRLLHFQVSHPFLLWFYATRGLRHVVLLILPYHLDLHNPYQVRLLSPPELSRPGRHASRQSKGS
jgi:hypothetical protein